MTLMPTNLVPILWPRVLTSAMVAIAFFLPVPGRAGPTEKSGVVEVTLNGLKITLEAQSGSIVALDYPGPGRMLEAKPGLGGLLDLAYPIPEFDPLRLAARHSQGVKIEQTPDSVVISWENLGASRPYFKVPGKVSAKVWLTAMPDGRSVSMKCQIVNASERPVGQVLFPDLHGLLPFAGEDATYLRSAGFTRKPFQEVKMTAYPEFYATDRHTDTRDTFEYTGGGKYGEGNMMIGRWLDYGGLSGGLSLFPKVWTGAPLTKVRIFRLENEPNVRLAHLHDVSIEPSQTWESAEYVLTPHRQGWARGIEVYRDFVNSQIRRAYPVPRHVREGLGYRTVFVCKGYPADGARDIAFTFKELPDVAREAKAHGLDELVVWFWQESFVVPGPPPYPHLGTPEDLAQAIRECEELGVNVALFVSYLSLGDATARKYGLRVSPQDYTYHPELIPRINSAYATRRRIVKAPTGDPRWREDVLASVREIHGRYTRSICWDEANVGTEPVLQEILSWAKARDPRATFSGEITGSAERCADFLDYTWNWESGSYHSNLLQPYRDDRGFIAAFPAPRLNKGVNRNAQHIKYYFMDNGYLNVMPSAPDEPNGTAWLKDYPDVSSVLQQVAGVRRQFVKYFSEGTLIGDCLLQEMPAGTHVNAYVLPDRVLFLIMNRDEATRPVDFHVDLAPWLKSGTGNYEVRSYDQHGKKLGAGATIGADWQGKTLPLEPHDFAICEFIAQ